MTTIIKASRKYLLPDWPAPKNIRAYTTTRQGGHSLGAYDSFNLAAYVSDDPTAVSSNIDSLVNDLNLPETPLWLNQVHGNCAVPIDECATTPQADASYTQQKNKICAVLTADCLPVLLCNRDGTEVAAVHAGWKGLLVNVIAATVAAMKTPASDLVAWLGPALSQAHFEFGNDVHADFINANPDYQTAFARRKDRWYLDPYAIAREQLKQAQVMAVYGGGLCTYANKNDFYSFRRDKGTTGRLATLIYRE